MSGGGGAISTRTVALVLVAIAATDVVVNRLDSPATDPALRIVLLTAFVLWARRGARLSWDELGLARDKLGAGLRLGALAALAVAAVIALLVAIPGSRSYFAQDSIANDSTLMHVLEPLVLIPLGTVVFEEMIFRGVLLATLLRATTRTRAVVISALAFGFWHIPPALTDAEGRGFAGGLGVVLGTIAVTTVAGAGFTWLRLRAGSLLAPILAHIGTNSFAYVAALSVT